MEYHCYHRPPDECPPLNATSRCKVDDKCKFAVLCCNLSLEQIKDEFTRANINLANHRIQAIHIRNASIQSLNLNELKSWRTLTSLSITDGNIGNVTGEFGKHSSVACLNMSSNGITNFENRSLVNLYNMTMLDLSHNNLSNVPRFKKDGDFTLDISNNAPMFCTNLYEIKNGRPEIQFNNYNNTKCCVTNNFHWFNSTDFISLEEVERIYQIRQNCTKNCKCEPHRWHYLPGQPTIISVKVDCSKQNFTEMPTPLPQNAISLNISYNNISSLESFSSDDTYKSVRELYADNNEITSILPLEGTNFISNFALLRLKHNKLKSIPTYLLTNIFDRNYISRHVYLGQNYLQCDCNTAKVLKVWLLTKQKHVLDFDEIYCENMNVKVIDLNASTLCQSQHDWTDYIYYIITLEVFLLVGLIAKVFYDYWVFKTAGYLPWPASKMPKLPCDWLCE